MHGILGIGLTLIYQRGPLAMEVNDLGFIASILFVLVPSVFLLILYIQTASREGREDS